MKTFTKEELDKILENHKHWMNKDIYGWERMQADLCEANLSGEDLHGAILIGANLRGADLCGANLCAADLYGADLSDAYLYGTNLYNADLRRADLRGATINKTNLYGANLCGALNVPFIPMTCPDEGCFFGWKQAWVVTDMGRYKGVVKLFIPSDAKRSSATGRKCRCDKAVVVDIELINVKDSDIKIIEARSFYCEDFKYRIHETVSVANFDENRFNECGPGIHFFINKQEAIDY